MADKKYKSSKKIKTAIHSFRKSGNLEYELKKLLELELVQFKLQSDYQDRPSWDEAFMLAAYEASTRGSCFDIKTGAVVVRDNRVKSSGYNGAPPGIKNCLEVGCRKKLFGIDFSEKRTGNCRGAHAERNAMGQIAREDLKGAKLYTVFFPCSDCAKEIVGNGISEVIYSMIYKEPDSLTNELFSEAGVTLRNYKPNIIKQFIRLMKVYNQRAE